MVYSGTSKISSTQSRPLSPPAGVNAVDFFMQQARARAGARTPSTTPLILPTRTKLDAENELALDRCIARSEALLAETRAYLGQPQKLPSQLARPVQYAEMRMSSGAKPAKVTAAATEPDSRRAYDSAETLLTLQGARRTPLPHSPRGAPSRPSPSLSSGSTGSSRQSLTSSDSETSSELSSEELEFASQFSTSMDITLSAFSRDADGFFQVARTTWTIVGYRNMTGRTL